MALRDLTGQAKYARIKKEELAAKLRSASYARQADQATHEASTRQAHADRRRRLSGRLCRTKSVIASQKKPQEIKNYRLWIYDTN